MAIVVRNLRPDDVPIIKAIHESTGIDYQFPDIQAPLFLVTKVLECDGVVRQAGGAYIQAELYLWADQSPWGTPEQKLDGIRQLEREVIHELYLRGVDCAVLRLPPGYERFGERLIDLGFTLDREWATYSKPTTLLKPY